MSFKIDSSHRVLIAGKTGSGKTYAAGQLLAGFNRLLVIDPKDELATEWGLQPYSVEAARRREFRLHTADMSRADEVFHTAYHAGGCIVYCDEGYALFSPETSRKDNANVLKVYTQGRSKGVGVWLSIQRPAWLALYAISEVEHALVFKLRLEEDRKRVASAFGKELENAPTGGPHAFWYYSDKLDKPHLYRELPKVPKIKNVIPSSAEGRGVPPAKNTE